MMNAKIINYEWMNDELMKIYKEQLNQFTIHNSN